MPSNKMRAFIAQNPNLTREQIEAERQRRIHHVGLSASEYAKMHGWTLDSVLTGQEELF